MVCNTTFDDPFSYASQVRWSRRLFCWRLAAWLKFMIWLSSLDVQPGGESPGMPPTPLASPSMQLARDYSLSFV